jgi:hypothetical protein
MYAAADLDTSLGVELSRRNVVDPLTAMSLGGCRGSGTARMAA